jgi:hypothetical protein
MKFALLIVAGIALFLFLIALYVVGLCWWLFHASDSQDLEDDLEGGE